MIHTYPTCNTEGGGGNAQSSIWCAQPKTVAKTEREEASESTGLAVHAADKDPVSEKPKPT